MIQSILVPLDGSKRAEEILPHAVDLASKFGATITLVQVLTPIYHMESLEMPGYAQVILDDMAEMKERALTYLKNQKLALEKGATQVQVQIRIEQGQPVERILAVSDEMDIDLIAMNSHGRTGVPRVLFGSIAAGVLHGTDRPLYLIRSDSETE